MRNDAAHSSWIVYLEWNTKFHPWHRLNNADVSLYVFDTIRMIHPGWTLSWTWGPVITQICRLPHPHPAIGINTDPAHDSYRKWNHPSASTSPFSPYSNRSRSQPASEIFTHNEDLLHCFHCRSSLLHFHSGTSCSEERMSQDLSCNSSGSHARLYGFDSVHGPLLP